MKLDKNWILERGEWEGRGVALPMFDIEKMKSATENAPTWVHFGAGNLFRAFQAGAMQTLLDEGAAGSGIVVGEGFDFDIIDKIYAPHDNLSLLVTMNADGSIAKKLVASVASARKCDAAFAEDWEFFKSVFEKPSLQMATYTITEKGYALLQGDEFLPVVLNDFGAGPDGALATMMGKTAALVFHRHKTCAMPLALVSMDNCSQNGEKLRAAVMAVAEKWVENGFCGADFLSYLKEKISFPWTMIDKITPRPDEAVKKTLEAEGFADMEIVVTPRNTYIAPFVNAERPQYLVIEDDFPNGRPSLEKAGVYFADRDTVSKSERMKVCTCLNPLHTCLAVFGCLLGYTLIADEMKDKALARLVREIGLGEGMAVVTDPKIIEPKKFIAEVLEERLPNPFMPDTPQRIATDTSQKLPIRFGETIKAYIASDSLDAQELKFIPLVYAAWLRYLLAVDDEGRRFEPSSDPRLASCQKKLENISLGDAGPFDGVLRELLGDESLFGVDLHKAGLAERVAGYFAEMVSGAGAVRRTLERVLGM